MKFHKFWIFGYILFWDIRFIESYTKDYIFVGILNSGVQISYQFNNNKERKKLLYVNCFLATSLFMN